MRPDSVALASILLAAAPVAQEPEWAPGLVLEFDVDGATDARRSRLVALHVPAGEVPTPFLPAGPFEAEWRGGLEVAFRDRYTFSIEGNGDLQLSIGGKQLALGKARRLKRGIHDLVVRYRSPRQGDARVRLLWAGSDFAAEPVPPRNLHHHPDDGALREGLQRREGRRLLAERQCTRCHHPERAVVTAYGSMPELAMSGPALNSVGARLRQPWLEAWILDPRSLRVDSTMPVMLHGAGAGDDARDIAAFLARTGTPRAGSLPRTAEHVREGAVLFAELGCIGCHSLPGAADPGERVALGYVGAKYHDAALVDYLLRPDRHRPWTAMPDFGLSTDEAGRIAAFLLDRGTATPPKITGRRAADPVRGRELTATLGCLKCHHMDVLGEHPAPDWRELRDWQGGCMASSEVARGVAPGLGLNAEQRAAVRAVAGRIDSLRRFVPVEFAARRIEAQRCNACHTRDGVSDLWSERVGEVAPLLTGVEPPHLAQTRPSLTWAGEKLRGEWTESLLRGEVGERPRPWLRARMPAFRAGAALLARGMAGAHGTPFSEPRTTPDPVLAAIGEKLVGNNGGFACTLCHGLGAQAPAGVFEVQGINFTLTADRLRHGFYHRWMRDPLRIDPSSRMPKYASPEGKTAFSDVLGGDAARQFEAMWHFLITRRNDR